ncbi:DapH/DapD/GlmU-related protein [Veronia pacifica]|uniref:Acetyltransferase n=1 Tax=Veronia pacifica TaxID=1080227 RepID=A0A1C3EIH6_9GAMM|nr:DapH/DapD/GlmU-related protein [Veronia pacifica]ODA33034.1 acetyltransferase [Veronia pacifica]
MEQKPSRLTESPSVAESAVIELVTFGRWVEIGQRTVLQNVEIGDYSYIVDDAEVANCTIGKFTSIAAKVRINPGNHPWWRPTLHHFTYRPGQYGMLGDDEVEKDPEIFNWRKENAVAIGHDVWIGHGVVITAGVTIGDGAIIGAGSIVTKDVAPYTVVVGNPAKLLRPRFEDPRITERLAALQWWDWPDEKIRELLPEFQKDAESFLAAIESL